MRRVDGSSTSYCECKLVSRQVFYPTSNASLGTHGHFRDTLMYDRKRPYCLSGHLREYLFDPSLLLAIRMSDFVALLRVHWWKPLLGSVPVLLLPHVGGWLHLRNSLSSGVGLNSLRRQKPSPVKSVLQRVYCYMYKPSPPP